MTPYLKEKLNHGQTPKDGRDGFTPKSGIQSQTNTNRGMG